jgi:hypothetical protein
MRLKKIKFECPFDTDKIWNSSSIWYIYRIIKFQMLCIYKIYYVFTILPFPFMFQTWSISEEIEKLLFAPLLLLAIQQLALRKKV